MWDADTVSCLWNRIRPHNRPLSTKEFENKIRLCERSRENINLSGHILALVPWLLLDWIGFSPFSSWVEKDFSAPAKVILGGKSPLAIIRYKCWTYLCGYNLFKQSHRSLAVAARCRDALWETMAAWEFRADVFRNVTRTLIRLFLFFPNGYFWTI